MRASPAGLESQLTVAPRARGPVSALGMFLAQDFGQRRTRAPRPRYRLTSVTRDGRPIHDVVWANALRSAYGEFFGNSPVGELALSLLCTSPSLPPLCTRMHTHYAHFSIKYSNLW